MSDAARLHAAIRDAHAADRVVLDVAVKAVSRKGSPSFRTTDIVVPWFVAVVISAYVAVAYGVVAAVALFVAAAGIIVVLLRPFNHRRTVARTTAAALATLENWQTLWRMGGLALHRRDDAGTSCDAPAGDWQGFARGLAGPGADRP